MQELRSSKSRWIVDVDMLLSVPRRKIPASDYFLLFATQINEVNIIPTRTRQSIIAI